MIIKYNWIVALSKPAFYKNSDRNLIKITWKYSGIHKGSTTASSRSLFASVSPATSSHLTPGEVSNTSLSSIAANSGSGPSY